MEFDICPTLTLKCLLSTENTQGNCGVCVCVCVQVCSAEYHLHRLTVLGTGLSMVDTSIHSSPEEVQDHDLLVCQIQFNDKSVFTPYLVSGTPIRSSGYRQHLRPGSTFFARGSSRHTVSCL